MKSRIRWIGNRDAGIESRPSVAVKVPVQIDESQSPERNQCTPFLWRTVGRDWASSPGTGTNSRATCWNPRSDRGGGTRPTWSASRGNAANTRVAVQGGTGDNRLAQFRPAMHRTQRGVERGRDPGRSPQAPGIHPGRDRTPRANLMPPDGLVGHRHRRSLPTRRSRRRFGAGDGCVRDGPSSRTRVVA